MTHNVAIIPDDKGGFLAVGGQYKNVKKGKKVSHAGIWLVHGTSWRFFDSRASGQARSHPPVELQRSVTASAREAMSEQTGSLSTFPQSATSTLFESPNNSYPSSNWGAARLILKGNHPGCVERRHPALAKQLRAGFCEFDGRLSLVKHHGQLLLYARANPATHGQRFVQVSRSFDGGTTWSSFKLIKIDGYSHVQGDIYFFSASVNPVHPSSLIAVFPLVHRLRGCIAMSTSLDGQRWSAPTSFIECEAYGARSAHQPVQGLVSSLDGKFIYIYIHENVRGVTMSMFVPKLLKIIAYLRQPPSQVVRYSIPSRVLRNWTRSQLKTLKQARDA